jgi:predicted  nucleic acid-binding Zn-ribbon protein
MSTNVTNELIYETLKRMQETLSLHTQYHLETKERLGFIEQQYASISRRIDRIDERLERVERRLDLVEA